MLRYARCNIVIVMAATAWLCPAVTVSCVDLIRIPYCWSVPGEEIFSWDTWTVRYTNQIRTRYRNWRTTSATQLQPSQSLRYIRHTSTWWQHNCSLTVQTHYAIYILTPERISQGHVQNGRRAIFSWHILYNPWPYINLIRYGDKTNIYR